MKFTAIVTALIALVAPAAAFMPTSARTRGLTTIKMGYVPDGLTPAQYSALKAKEVSCILRYKHIVSWCMAEVTPYAHVNHAQAAAAKANKKRAMKGSVEDLTTWQARAEKQNPNQVGG